MGQYDRGHGMCVCGPVGQRSPPVLAGESKKITLCNKKLKGSEVIKEYERI